MKQYPRIFLKPAKEAAIRRYHPWIFSGAIEKPGTSLSEGDVVEIYSSSSGYLATGHYLGGSIAVKIFSFKRQEIDYVFWKEKLKDSYQLRERLGLNRNPLTNAYRLVFSEGDSIPGLVIDYYNGVAVVQTHSMGMHRIKPDLVNALKEIYGDQLKAVYDKSSETMKSKIPDQYLYGTPRRGLIKETGHSFLVDWEQGQKTGYFLDQRNNRMFAQFYAKDKKVLNAFCYSGAFSVYALKGGAKMVYSIDSSRQAIAWTEENMVLNGIDKSRHTSIATDVKNFLAGTDEMFDMIILDPPAFAKTHTVTHNALQAYRFINAEALKKIAKGGLLFTFSCSQAISREMFHRAVHSASLETGREIRILHTLSQGQDHPVSIYHPEGEYLKGLILYVL